MPDLTAPDLQFARLVIERGLAAIYLIAFLVALDQFPALLGERGLLPVPRFLAGRTFREAPSLFHLGYSDRRLIAVGATGAMIATLVLVGLLDRAPLPVTMAAWFVLWVLYQSIVNVGQTFYAFGWETLLLEAGFLAIFLGNGEIAPPWSTLVLFRWLAFRVEFGAGLIKLRGDRCWRDLTCMDWHHETQPLPNPLSWFFHRLPRAFHRIEVVGNFVAQLVLPFGLFLPQPVASVAAILMIGTQLYLVVSGNYAWLNWLTIVAAAAAIADVVVPRPVLEVLGLGIPAGAYASTPVWFTIASLGLVVLVVILSWFPVRNLLSPSQAMNASFDPFHLVNTYGAFGTVGRTRDEVIIEGHAGDPADEDGWREYGFRAKPGDVRRLSPQVAPYHHRLDWLMWFIPLSPFYAQGWFGPFLERLLRGDRAILRLLGRNPFPAEPPVWIRASYFRYRYTSREERRSTGAWWVRTRTGEVMHSVRLPPAESDAERGGRS
jgi:lipase maturation factor